MNRPSFDSIVVRPQFTFTHMRGTTVRIIKTAASIALACSALLVFTSTAVLAADNATPAPTGNKITIPAPSSFNVTSDPVAPLNELPKQTNTVAGDLLMGYAPWLMSLMGVVMLIAVLRKKMIAALILIGQLLASFGMIILGPVFGLIAIGLFVAIANNYAASH